MNTACQEIRELLQLHVQTEKNEPLAGKAAFFSACAACGSFRSDALGNLILQTGKEDAPFHLLLEAHYDRIGLLVTQIDSRGFLSVAAYGGIDARVLPGSRVIVNGKEPLPGIICCMPPHLNDGKEASLSLDNTYVDTGLPAEQVKSLVSPGDFIQFPIEYQTLMETRIAGAGLDNYAGCAAILRCLQLIPALQKIKLSVLFSNREEIGRQGAITAAYALRPDACVATDVSFAVQPGVEESLAGGALSAGTMIGISPSLDPKLTARLIDLAKRFAIPYQLEVTGATTATDADVIGTSRQGVRCALLSIPQRYMHTPVEVIDLADIESTAQLMAAYVEEIEKEIV